MAAAADIRPCLVLHLDLNKTLLMSDAAQSRGVPRVLGDVLAATTYGSVGPDGGFVWDGKQPTSTRPAEGISYRGWLKHQALVQEKDQRFAALGTEGGDCIGVAETRRQIEEALRVPPGMEEAYAGLFREGSFARSQQWRFVMPAFFHMVRWLCDERRRFAILLRTFGWDIQDVCDEIEAFAEGRHPLHPVAEWGRYDGSDGRPDLRSPMSRKESHGTFYRDSENPHLVMGTVARPPPVEGVSEIGMRFYEGSGLTAASGHEAIAACIAELAKPGAFIALRDDWPYWGIVGRETAETGKLLYVPRDDPSTHHIFIDDHVTSSDARIVDARFTTGEPVPFAVAKGVHLLRAEPLDCALNENYFADLICRAEAAFQAAHVHSK